MCEKFDVFLSHNSKDKPAVCELAKKLEEKGIHAWFDEWELVPGLSWQPVLESVIETIPAAAVFVGKDGIGPWQGIEIQACLKKFVDRKMPVIPVLLPDAPQQLELPPFLNAIMYVDLRKENQDEGVRRLICGIRGERPGPGFIAATVEMQGGGIAVGIGSGRGHSNRSRLLGPIPELFGRDKELAKLNDLLEDSKTHIVAIVGPGGIGKSALVRVWRENLDLRDKENAIAYFDWCFRDQVNRGYEADAATAFVNEALASFGDDSQRKELPGESGARLARRVVEAGKRTILILDNIESLQWSAGPRQGEFRDNDLGSFLLGIKDSRFTGLCVVTTQQRLTDLKNRGHVKEIKLGELLPPAGAKLLFEAGAQKWGDIPLTPNAEELRATSKALRGHPLSLDLLGKYVGKCLRSDLGKAEPNSLDKAYVELRDKVSEIMDDYEKWLRRDGGDRGKRMLAILELLAFFDRPAAQHCMKAIYDGEPIDGLTEPLIGVGEQEWNAAEEELVRLGLVVRSERESDLDVHAVVRAHFATKLRNRTEAWHKGHRRLFEHLFFTTDSIPDTVEGLQPLYQAIFHGCQAGLYKDAWKDVYLRRIMRVDGERRKVWGNIASSNLLALRCFFEEPWKTIWSEIDSVTQANLRAETAFYLRATGRLEEALERWNVGFDHFAANGDLVNAARAASNRSELRLARGELGAAEADALLSVELADPWSHDNVSLVRDTLRTPGTCRRRQVHAVVHAVH